MSGFIVAFEMTAAVFPWKLTLCVDTDRICILKIEYLCDTWCVCADSFGWNALEL